MENVKVSLGGYRLEGEIQGDQIPIGFVNGLRRILLAEIPTVVLTDVQILDNTTHMTHEMIRHRIEMLPVNVRPEEAAVVRDTKIELRFAASPEEREITANDFVVTGPRANILLPDRDLGEPIYFMTLKPNTSIHIKATLGVETRGTSQVCVSAFKNHIDPEQAKTDRGLWIDNGGDPRVFDNFIVQRSYSRNKKTQRPNWFDITVESIGVVPAADLLKKAADVLKTKVLEWVKTPLLREEAGWYRMETEGETFTLGQLIQELMYQNEQVNFVSRDVGHPLVPKLVVRFNTPLPPDQVIAEVRDKAVALCESILGSV
jgi:DNA-directed RNA polymerase subunit L